MPSINEVWEQALAINANLAIVHNDLLDLKTCCVDTNSKLDQLRVRADESNDWLEEVRDLLSSGFATMASGFEGVHQRQDISNQILVFQARQLQTVICVLENISRNTCALVNTSDAQLRQQTEATESVGALRHMYATANPDAALVLSRADEDAARMAKCCPDKPVPPPCTYQACDDARLPQPGKPTDSPTMTHRETRVVRVERQG